MLDITTTILEIKNPGTSTERIIEIIRATEDSRILQDIFEQERLRNNIAVLEAIIIKASTLGARDLASRYMNVMIGKINPDNLGDGAFINSVRNIKAFVVENAIKSVPPIYIKLITTFAKNINHNSTEFKDCVYDLYKIFDNIFYCHNSSKLVSEMINLAKSVDRTSSGFNTCIKCLAKCAIDLGNENPELSYNAFNTIQFTRSDLELASKIIEEMMNLTKNLHPNSSGFGTCIKYLTDVAIWLRDENPELSYKLSYRITKEMIKLINEADPDSREFETCISSLVNIASSDPKLAKEIAEAIKNNSMRCANQETFAYCVSALGNIAKTHPALITDLLTEDTPTRCTPYSIILFKRLNTLGNTGFERFNTLRNAGEELDDILDNGRTFTQLFS